jgi:hypothetical protein
MLEVLLAQNMPDKSYQVRRTGADIMILKSSQYPSEPFLGFGTKGFCWNWRFGPIAEQCLETRETHVLITGKTSGERKITPAASRRTTG